MAPQPALATPTGEGGLREIVVDTETTGLDPQLGHRIVEIAALELMHHVPTGRRFHCYVNPERDMPADAYAVHGLTEEFLAAHQPFAGVIDDFLGFVGDAPLVIHNAEFDIAFLNAELARAGRPFLSASFVDTLSLARRRFPGAPASLDALCRRFTIDLSARDKHGAEIDCGLLAEVYVELLGGRQPGLDFATAQGVDIAYVAAIQDRPVRPPRPHAPSADELAAHRALLATISNPLWLADGLAG
jgi:DNA polymerase-3 subunit epsilon